MEQPQRGTYQDDEISLVDLAKILIRRRWWLFGTFGAILIFALAFVLLANVDPEYQYTSIYQQAETGPGRPLTSSESIIQQMESLDWANYQRRYREENNVDILPFDLEINNPSNSTLITLKSVAVEEDYEEVVSLHEQLVESTIERQQAIFENQKSQLESAIERISSLLERVENSNSDASVEIAANYADRLFQLERDLENLTEGEVIEYAAQGEKQGGTPVILILALGIVLGSIAGVMAAFFAEFVCRVRKSLKDEQKENA